MSKLSTQVENQIRISRKVVASAKTHGRTAAAALAALVTGAEGATSTPESAQPEAAGKPAQPEDKAQKDKAQKGKAQKGKAQKGKPAEDTTPIEAAARYEQLILELAGSLERSAEALSMRELEYTAEQADDGPIREARDAKVKHAVALLTRLRSTVEDALGPSALRTYGLHQETPRAPRTVLSHLQNVASLLRQKPTSVTTELGSTFETLAAAQALEAVHKELTALIGDEDREERELQDALTKRNRAQEVWSRAYQGVATTLEGLYLLAGWKELADRVRPTQRTLRGEDTGEPEDGAAAEGDDKNKNGGPTGG
jgi:hypothetical protein